MYGPSIFVRFLGTPGNPTQGGLRWQYHSRSDRHSKAACWGAAFDLLLTSAALRDNARRGKIVLGVNHRMRDYATNKDKDLDLVFARPGEGDSDRIGSSFKDLRLEYGIDLDVQQLKALDGLPDIPVGAVGATQIALEAKACMTAHVKAIPRLHDELNSSHLAIHGASTSAIAIGFVQLNNSSRFVSPNPKNVDRIQNGFRPEVTVNRQPAATERVLEMLTQLPRRSGNSGVGFDALGVMVLDFANDGGPVDLVTSAPAPQPGDTFHYGSMIVRMANEYDARFSNI